MLSKLLEEKRIGKDAVMLNILNNGTSNWEDKIEYMTWYKSATPKERKAVAEKYGKEFRTKHISIYKSIHNQADAFRNKKNLKRQEMITENNYVYRLLGVAGKTF